MITWRIFFNCLLYRSSPGNGVLLPKGFDLNSQNYLVTGTILITSDEWLFDDLDLPFTETMDSWVRRTAYIQSESQQSGKLFVFLAGELCAIVTDDFL